MNEINFNLKINIENHNFIYDLLNCSLHSLSPDIDIENYCSHKHSFIRVSKEWVSIFFGHLVRNEDNNMVVHLNGKYFVYDKYNKELFILISKFYPITFNKNCYEIKSGKEIKNLIKDNPYFLVKYYVSGMFNSNSFVIVENNLANIVNNNNKFR